MKKLYYQSKRIELYQNAIEKLLETGNAYRCFCSRKKLQKKENKLEMSGDGYFYSGTCRNLNENIIQENIKNGDHYSVSI